MLQKALKLLKNVREFRESAFYNRKCVGQDLFGNSYYQYFDNNGAEIRRHCDLQNTLVDVDPVWQPWLQYRQEKPYTPEELKKIYADMYEKRKRGIKADEVERQKHEVMEEKKRRDSFNGF